MYGKYENLFYKLDVYLDSLVQKAKVTMRERATHVWEDKQLREVETYLRKFNTPINRTQLSVVPFRGRQSVFTDTFVNEEALVDDDDIMSVDEEDHIISSNCLSQADLDFLDNRSVDSRVGESGQHMRQPSP